MFRYSDMKKLRGRRKGIIHCEMSYSAPPPELDFKRADLIFYGVDHSSASYDVRVFLNNTRANLETERSIENGYCGRFVVFGHGGCFGDDGHCSIRRRSGNVFDKRPSHALVPQTKIITVTHALKALLDSGDDLNNLALVPYIRTPLRKDRDLKDGIFAFDGLRLQLYS